MKCCEEVYRGTSRVIGVGHYSQCQREAVVKVDGKWYCRQHSPEKVKERQELSRERAEARWRSKMRARQAYLKSISSS